MTDDGPAEQARAWRLAPGHAMRLGALCWAGFAGIAAMVVWGGSARFDDAGMLLWRSGTELGPVGPDWLTGVFLGFTALGNAWPRHVLTLLAMAALGILRKPRAALVLALTVFPAVEVGTLLKLAFGRARPQIVPHLANAGGLSFPSGHAFNAAVLFLSLALVFAVVAGSRRIGWALLAGAITVSGLIAFSRVWLGVHYPTDVAGGWLAGAGWALLAWGIGQKMIKDQPG